MRADAKPPEESMFKSYTDPEKSVENASSPPSGLAYLSLTRASQ